MAAWHHNTIDDRKLREQELAEERSKHEQELKQKHRHYEEALTQRNANMKLQMELLRGLVECIKTHRDTPTVIHDRDQFLCQNSILA